MQMICFTSSLKEPKGSKHELCEISTCICANRGFFVVCVYPRYLNFLGVNPGDKTPWDSLAGIATPSRVYLIDTGNEGRARDSRTP